MKGEGKRGLKREGELCLIIFFLEKGDYFRVGLNRGFMVALVFKHFLLISITNNMKNSTCREYNLLAGKRESFLSVFSILQ